MFYIVFVDQIDWLKDIQEWSTKYKDFGGRIRKVLTTKTTKTHNISIVSSFSIFFVSVGILCLVAAVGNAEEKKGAVGDQPAAQSGRFCENYYKHRTIVFCYRYFLLWCVLHTRLGKRSRGARWTTSPNVYELSKQPSTQPASIR